MIRFILYQYHHCQVTQHFLHEMLSEVGVDISTGQINRILTENVESFHKEKDDIIRKGLEISSWIQTDDTEARHQGKTGYCTHIGNDLFAWFGSTPSKIRVNFLKILGSSFGGGYQITPLSLQYMKQEKLPKVVQAKLETSLKSQFEDEESWSSWLKEVGIEKKRHVKIATEGALLGRAIEAGFNPELIILSDDAGQFNVPLLVHALCWVHAIHLIKKLVPPSDKARLAQEQVLEDALTLYQKLKQHSDDPSFERSLQIKETFTDLFTRKTDYATLNLLLKRIHKNKDELLVVVVVVVAAALEHHEVPIHNNASEGDIRDFVKRSKVTGGTRSSSGRQARDTFASIKKTCRKLAMSFWELLGDRLSGGGQFPVLSELMEAKAVGNIVSAPLSKRAAIG